MLPFSFVLLSLVPTLIQNKYSSNKRSLFRLLQQRHRNRFSQSVSVIVLLLWVGYCLLSYRFLYMKSVLCFTDQIFSNLDLIRVTYALFVIPEQLSFCDSRVKALLKRISHLKSSLICKLVYIYIHIYSTNVL